MTDASRSTRGFAGLQRADWLCAAGLAAMTLAVFWQGLVKPAAMIHEDAAYLFQPYYTFAADEVRSGRMPHWNPYAACGLPYHATLQGAVLYPLRWPLFWLGYVKGYALLLWVHYFLTGLFAFAFIRTSLACRPVPALMGAISFAFGGFALGHVTHLNYVQAYPWFVLTIFLLSRAFERRHWGYAIGAAVPIGLMGLVGAVHLLLILGFGLGVLALVEIAAWLRQRGPSGRSGVVAALWPAGALALAVVLGGGIAAAQLWPAQLQMALSSRPGLGWEFITEISAHPLRTLVRLVVPFYWGNYHLGYWGENLFHEQCFYAGSALLVLTVLAVVMVPRNRWVVRLVVLAVAAGLAATGKHLPVYRFLYDWVPLFDRLRSPARLMWWVEFAIACLGAIGLNGLMNLQGRPLVRRARVAAVATALAMLVVMAGCLARLAMLANDPAPAVEQVQHLSGPAKTNQSLWVEAAKTMPGRVMKDGDAVTWLGIGAAVASVVLVCLVAVRARRWPAVVGYALVVLLAIELGTLSAGMLIYTTGDRVLLGTPPTARYLQQHLGLARYARPNSYTDDVALHRGMLFRVRHAIGAPGGIFHTPRQNELVALLWRLHPRVLNLTGVRYLVTDRPLQSPWPSPALTTKTSVITENPRAMPLAFLATEVRAFDDPNGVLKEILHGSADLAEVALVEQPVEPLPIGNVDSTPRGVVADVTGVPGRYRMRIRTPGPRQLVLTETYHPQWQCLVNGQPAPVFRTDRWFMSARVPLGDYEVVWRFTPTRFRQGMVVSVVAWMIVIVALLVVRRGTRRSRAGGLPPKRGTYGS